MNQAAALNPLNPLNPIDPTPAGAPGAVALIRVFIRDHAGGNPVPLVADARGMSAAAMQEVAARHGHESAFVLPPEDPSHDWRFRFFVPQHEMEMCGHATVGTLWALRQWGLWTTPVARIETLSGTVDAYWDAERSRAWISQPAVTTRVLTDAERRRVAAVLGLPPEAARYAMTNAATSRVKTLVALPSVAMLHGLRPDFGAMEHVCASIDSTGLYPYALEAVGVGGPMVHARQFPKSSGYPEDAATGIAAAALWGYLTGDDVTRDGATGDYPTGAGPLAGAAGDPPALSVRQGDTMGSPSEIFVAPRRSGGGQPDGCWLSGNVEWSSE